jgi:hypothetical protein
LHSIIPIQNILSSLRWFFFTPGGVALRMKWRCISRRRRIRRVSCASAPGQERNVCRFKQNNTLYWYKTLENCMRAQGFCVYVRLSPWISQRGEKEMTVLRFVWFQPRKAFCHVINCCRSPGSGRSRKCSGADGRWAHRAPGFHQAGQTEWPNKRSV